MLILRPTTGFITLDRNSFIPFSDSDIQVITNSVDPVRGQRTLGADESGHQQGVGQTLLHLHFTLRQKDGQSHN